MSTKTKKAVQAVPRRPEKKWGPFPGGVGVAVWLNEVETDSGKRFFRSVSIAPRRYRAKTGEWEDSGSFRPQDLAALQLALAAAQDFIATTPLPGQPADDEPHDVPLPAESNNGAIPF